MAADPELVAETRSWLVKAREDLAVAQHSLTATTPFLSAALFHVQQAAEKALKGFLTWHATPFRKTHSLEELGEQCLRIDDSLRTVVDSAAPLAQYAWKFRYPGESAEPTHEEAERAIATAREAYDAVIACLPAEVHP